MQLVTLPLFHETGSLSYITPESTSSSPLLEQQPTSQQVAELKVLLSLKQEDNESKDRCQTPDVAAFLRAA